MNDNCPIGNTACGIVNGGSDEGVYWYRGIADEELTQTEVDDIISSFGGEKMIFGHTVFPQVSSIYQHKVLVADVDHGENFASGFMEALYYENGCYYRLVANSSGTGITPIESDCTSVSNIELTTNNEINFSITPQLFENEITIQHSDVNVTKAKIFIYNIEGEIIDSFRLNERQKNMTLNTENWNEGIYIITIQTKNYTSSKKAIKH